MLGAAFSAFAEAPEMVTRWMGMSRRVTINGGPLRVQSPRGDPPREVPDGKMPKSAAWVAVRN